VSRNLVRPPREREGCREARERARRVDADPPGGSLDLRSSPETFSGGGIMTRIATLTAVLVLTSLSSTGLAQEPVRPASVELTPAALELAVGESRTLTARGLDAQGRAIADAVVLWLSSNIDIVVVDEAGVITAVRPGQARFAAVVNGVAAIGTVTVPPLPPASIELALPGGDVQAGASAPLTVAVRTRLGDLLPDAALTFTSSDEAVARVDATGRVH